MVKVGNTIRHRNEDNKMKDNSTNCKCAVTCVNAVPSGGNGNRSQVICIQRSQRLWENSIITFFPYRLF